MSKLSIYRRSEIGKYCPTVVFEKVIPDSEILAAAAGNINIQQGLFESCCDERSSVHS